MKPEANRTLIAMSGGVDSAVAALLAKERGDECVGVTMKLFENEDVGEDSGRSCCSLSDAEDARRVAQLLGIPFYIFDFTAEFRDQVIGRFVSAYMEGRTPNPCIDCNRFIKFRRLFERMEAMDFDYVATGHYARISRDGAGGRRLLLKAADGAKDQSYVLYAMTQKQLAHTFFPLGGMTKGETRKIAEQRGFVNARKKDSQDICFVRGGNYGDFIENYTGMAFPSGDFTDREGNILGHHQGVIRYTIGQRKGLGKAMGRPMYVTEIEPEERRVTLGSREDLYETRARAGDINLIACERLDRPARVTAKIRYGQPAMPATAVQEGEDSLMVEFDSAQRAITKGQALVLYDGDVVIGGGTIA